jgi:hypothetical protein
MIRLFVAAILFLPSLSFSQADKTILFVLEPLADTTGWTIEPIASYRSYHFEEVIGRSSDPEAKEEGGNGELRAFTMDYFPKGKTYPLFSDNKKIGLAVITEPDTMYACLQITALADLRFSGLVTLGRTGRGLAINDARQRDKSVKLREPSAEDSAGALKAGRFFLSSQRVKESLVKQTKLSHLRAVDLNGDGKAELVADLEITEIIKQKDYEWNKEYSLSLILAEGDAGKWNVIYSDYYEGKSEEENRRQELVDVIDIDGDGTCEVVFKNYFYEAWNYTVVMKINGKWKQVFSGAGGGC